MNTKVPAHQNPFAAIHLDRLDYQFPSVGNSSEQIFERWQSLGFRASIVGPCGHGKSTLLDQMAKVIKRKGLGSTRIMLRRGEWRFDQRHREMINDTIFNDFVLFIDGVEQLPWWYWNWNLHFVWPKSLKLLITSHVAGRLPTLYRAETSPELLSKLVQELLSGRSLPHQDLGLLYSRHRGNLRMALLELYDRVAAGELKITRPIPNSQSND